VHGPKELLVSKLKSPAKPSSVSVHVPPENPRGVGRIQTRQRLQAEQVVSAPGCFHTNHGGSVMRIYASYGAVNLGKTCDFDVAWCCPPSSTRLLDTQEIALPIN